MSRTVPWSIKDGGADAHLPIDDGSEAPNHTVGDWLDALIVEDARRHSVSASQVGTTSSAPSRDLLAKTPSRAAALPPMDQERPFELAATGTDGPARWFASGERQSIHVFDMSSDSRRSASDFDGRRVSSLTGDASLAIGSDTGRSSKASPPPPSKNGGNLKEQSIRDAVAAIMRRQVALDSGLPPREVPPVSPPASSDAPTGVGDTGAAVAALETRLAGIRAGRSEERKTPELETRTRGARAPLGLDPEANQAFQKLGQDLRQAIQSLDQRLRPNHASVDTGPIATGPAVEDNGRLAYDLLQTTAPAPARVASGSGRPVHLHAPSTQAQAPFPDRFDSEGLWGDVRTLLDRFGSGSPIDALDRRMQVLAEKLEHHLESPSASSLIEDLSRRIDQLQATIKAPSSAQAGLEPLLRGVEERILKARAASTDIQNLEDLMRGLAQRIDASSRQPESKALSALETQIQRLGERLDCSEANLSSLDTIEKSLQGLFSHLEQTRSSALDAAEHAARTAARDTARAVMQDAAAIRKPDFRAEIAEQVTQEVQDLKQRHETSDRRTQAALSGLHQAIEKLVDRLAPATGEDADTRTTRRSTSASWATTKEVASPIVPEPEARSFEARPQPQLSVPNPADMLIEPGEGRASKLPKASRPEAPEGVAAPARSSGVAVPVMSVDGSAPFIAAARRAAQAAQASAASRHRPVAPRDAASASASPVAASAMAMLDRARNYVALRRRPMLLGLAGLVLMLGALEIVKVELETPAARPMTEAASAPIDGAVEPVQTTRAPSTVEAKVADLPPASTVDSQKAPSAGSTSSAPTVAAQDSETEGAEPAKSTPSAKVTNPFLAGIGPVSSGIGEGLKAMALAGDPAAEYEVGLRYVDGRSVARDPKIAAGWFEKAAAQGLAPAQYRLGSAYEKGVGETRDPAMAITWYSRAADAGNIRAMHNLAVMSAEGASGKPDYARAASLFGKAASFGVRDSQFNLAILYARGLGIEQNLAQSYTWFAIAAAQGDEDAAKKRDEVAGRLDAKTLESAKAAVVNFRAMPYVKVANDVMPPLGGWDALVSPTKPDAASQKNGASKVPLM